MEARATQSSPSPSPMVTPAIAPLFSPARKSVTFSGEYNFDLRMNSVYYKEHEDGIASNPVGSLSSGSGPWWSGLVTQSTFEESRGRLKPTSMENCQEQLTPIVPKPSPHGTNHLVSKENTTHFNILPGDCKNSSKGQKVVQFEAAFSVQSAPQEYGGHLELGFGQPTMDSYQLALKLDKAWKQSTESGAPVDGVSSLRRYEDARRLRVAVIHGLARMAAIMASTYKAYLGVGLAVVIFNNPDKMIRTVGEHG